MLLGLLTLAGCAGGKSPAATATTADWNALAPEEQRFLDTLSHRTFRWFWDTAHEGNGLTPDRWPTRSFASVGGSGFALTAYVITIGANSYTSGPLAFDMGNPAEDPPYGLWGILNQARVGGFMQGPNGSGPNNHMKVTWANIQFRNDKPTATEVSTWGKLKTLYR